MADINNAAQIKFEELKKRMKLDLRDIATTNVIENVIKENSTKNSLTEEDFNVLQNHPKVIASTENVVRTIDNFVEESFAFIEKLKLPPNLALAVGLIISGNKTKDNEDLIKAIGAIQKEINHG
jgi:hypothetical protein